MATVYFDCFSGASGDMIAGALIDAGVDFNTLREIISSLDVDGFELKAEKTVRGPLSGTDFRVEIAAGDHGHRGLSDIVLLIKKSALPEKAREISIATFERLAAAEADIHGKKVDEIHFHEVGAIDSIADITAIATCLHLLDINTVVCSPLPLGSGRINTAHGELPLPAPATVRLLAGAKTLPGDDNREMTTPTAAALLSTTAARFGPPPPLEIIADGYGAGDHPGNAMPNMLRAIIGRGSEDTDIDTVVELSANLDDCSGEILGNVVTLLLEHGCLDAWTCPVYTKKTRPAWVLSALCLPERVADAEALIFRETTTFGIRRKELSRRKLRRELITVETAWGPITVKTGRLGDEIISISPEFEDCRSAAESHDVPLREVMHAARKAAQREKA